jgi:hypothetical protein
MGQSSFPCRCWSKNYCVLVNGPRFISLIFLIPFPQASWIWLSIHTLMLLGHDANSSVWNMFLIKQTHSFRGKFLYDLIYDWELIQVILPQREFTLLFTLANQFCHTKHSHIKFQLTATMLVFVLEEMGRTVCFWTFSLCEAWGHCTVECSHWYHVSDNISKRRKPAEQ